VKWHHHFFYRKESWKTTWKLKLSVLVLIVLGLVLVRTFLSTRLVQSLVCAEGSPHSDALLLENFDPDYLVFERAETLRRSGVASRVFVPAAIGPHGEGASVHKGFVDVMARIARLPNVEVIPINEVEPISLNAAKQIRDFLLRERIKSVVVVSPGFRSRRSELVYGAVLLPAGIEVGCVPVFGAGAPGNWTETWHGIQAVTEQFAKLQYYRFFVLR
jgi:hypothetical protein